MESGQPEGNINRIEISQETISMEEGTTLLASAPAAPSHVVDLSAMETNKERRETMHNLQKEAFQLANYYFVFQGVIFTAFYSTPSNLKCKYRWVPFTLSFLAGILNLSALLTIVLKYKKLLDEEDCKATWLELEDVDGPPAPPGMRVSPHASAQEKSDQRRGGNSPPIMVSCVGNWRMLYVMGCMGLFAGFFVVTLVGCMEITCAKN